MEGQLVPNAINAFLILNPRAKYKYIIFTDFFTDHWRTKSDFERGVPTYMQKDYTVIGIMCFCCGMYCKEEWWCGLISRRCPGVYSVWSLQYYSRLFCFGQVNCYRIWLMLQIDYLHQSIKCFSHKNICT